MCYRRYRVTHLCMTVYALPSEPTDVKQVTQTALDLLHDGHKVYILADGVSSCNKEEVPIALARLRHEGAVPNRYR